MPRRRFKRFGSAHRSKSLASSGRSASPKKPEPPAETGCDNGSADMVREGEQSLSSAQKPPIAQKDLAEMYLSWNTQTT